MNNSKKRKEYMRNIYSQRWSKERIELGTVQKDKDLIHELSKVIKNGKILEVAIGDGFPYSNVLDEMGYELYGIDISPTHVDMVKESLPNINVYQGDAEVLKFHDNFFDIVFCFRSTWYFTNLIKSISEMLRVVKNDGLIMFDIQNSNHPIHIKYMKAQLRERKTYILIISIRLIKNFIKLIIRPIKFFPSNWSLKRHMIIDSPTDPSLINLYLSKNNINYKIYGVNWEDDSCSLEKINRIKDFDRFDRLVYKIHK
jgi:ubiquinone/menaquinone biosynthesis C-methylase UbiE